MSELSSSHEQIVFLSALRDLDTSRGRSGSDSTHAETGSVVDREGVAVMMRPRPGTNKVGGRPGTATRGRFLSGNNENNNTGSFYCSKHQLGANIYSGKFSHLKS